MAILGIVEVRLLLRVCTVLQALLLMAGDVETNPGPTGKEGIYKLQFSKVDTLPYVLLVGKFVTQILISEICGCLTHLYLEIGNNFSLATRKIPTISVFKSKGQT